MKYILKPVGLGAENLKMLKCDNEVNSVTILGRNITTGLDQPSYNNVQFVSRNHASLVVEKGKVYLKPDAKQAKTVHLNDKVCNEISVELKSGDVITLLGAIKYYSFQFIEDVAENLYHESEMASKKRRTESVSSSKREVINLFAETTDSSSVTDVCKASNASSSSTVIENNTVTVAAPVVSLPSKAEIDNKVMMSKLLRQYECSICYETMACSFSLSPCGDSFCYVCISDWARKHSNCPMCATRFDMKASMVSKLADNAIREILSTDAEQLQEWEGRAKEGLDSWKEQVLGVKPVAPKIIPPQIPTSSTTFIGQAPVRRTSSSAAVVDLTESSPPTRTPHTAPVHNEVINLNLPPPDCTAIALAKSSLPNCASQLCAHCRASFSNVSVVLGLHTSAPSDTAETIRLRSLAQWAALCKSWYHLQCFRVVNAHLPIQKRITYNSCKYTGKLTIPEQIAVTNALN